MISIWTVKFQAVSNSRQQIAIATTSFDNFPTGACTIHRCCTLTSSYRLSLNSCQLYSQFMLNKSCKCVRWSDYVTCLHCQFVFMIFTDAHPTFLRFAVFLISIKQRYAQTIQYNIVCVNITNVEQSKMVCLNLFTGYPTIIVKWRNIKIRLPLR